MRQRLSTPAGDVATRQAISHWNPDYPVQHDLPLSDVMTDLMDRDKDVPWIRS